jgi:hypothetical protein
MHKTRWLALALLLAAGCTKEIDALLGKAPGVSQK